MGIEVLQPDINESFVEFAVVPGKNQIRFGMSAIKNVGVGTVEEILKARKNKPFKSLEDFLSRINSKVVNRKTLESLIKTGAFDRFESRSILFNNIDLLLNLSNKIQKQKDSGQTDLFGNSVDEKSPISVNINFGPEDVHYSKTDYLQWERELLGLYLSDHPLSAYQRFLNEKTHEISSIDKSHDGKKAKIGGLVSAVRIIQTKKGDNMAFVKITDLTGEIELLLFPATYEQTAWLWEIDKFVFVEGSVSATDREGQPTDELKINVSTAREVTKEEAKSYKEKGKKPKSLDELKTKKPTSAKPEKIANRIFIRMANTDNTDLLKTLKKHIDNHKGDSEVVLVVGDQSQKQAIRIPEKTSQSNDSIDGLVQLFGVDNVKVG